MNDMRERINAIVQDESKTDALLAAGCVMPRFRVGQEVFWLTDNYPVKEKIIISGKVMSVTLDEKQLWLYCHYNCGLTFTHPERDLAELFATLAEAQAALEGK